MAWSQNEKFLGVVLKIFIFIVYEELLKART